VAYYAVQGAKCNLMRTNLWSKRKANIFKAVFIKVNVVLLVAWMTHVDIHEATV